MGMFSIELNTKDEASIVRFCEGLNYFLMAVSWGGHESLIMPACAFGSKSELPINLIRFYIGLEEADILIQDIEAALVLI